MQVTMELVPIIRAAAVKHYRRRLGGFPDISMDDIRQQAVVWIAAANGYDPRWAIGTWIGIVVRNRVEDIYRSRTSESRRALKHPIRAATADDDGMIAWASGIYEQARAMARSTTYTPGRPRVYSAAQELTLWAIRTRYGLSPAKMTALLFSSSLLVQSLDLRAVPSSKWWGRTKLGEFSKECSRRVTGFNGSTNDGCLLRNARRYSA